jgi:cytochrome c
MIMKEYIGVVAAALAMSVAVLSVATPAMSAADKEDAVATGQALMQKNCARCHAIGMEDSSHHEDAPPFRVVVTRYPPENLAEALAEGIVSGHPDMPEFVFQPDEIEAILAYLDSLTPPAREPPEQE